MVVSTTQIHFLQIFLDSRYFPLVYGIMSMPQILKVYLAFFVSISDLSYVADLDVEPYSSKGGSGRTFQLSVFRFKWQGYLLERIPESMDHIQCYNQQIWENS